MLAYIDTHTHNLQTDNPFAVVNIPVDQLKAVLQSSTDRFYSVGIHPWDVHTTDPSIFSELEETIHDKRIKAIGECGLDRNAKATFKEQGYFFERQILLSEKYQKPMIIHCVAAFNELILLRKRFAATQNWIVHGFRGKPEMAQQLLTHGFALSYGEKFNPQSVQLTPTDKLCIETDTSTIAVEDLYRQIAALKNCRPDELNAACRLLKLYVC